MSGPKTKCPSCGTEWDGPVVFCGECGARFTAPDAPARSPGRGFGKTTLGATPAVRATAQTKPLPAKPVIAGPASARSGPDAKPTLVIPKKGRDTAKTSGGQRGSAPELSVAVEVTNADALGPISDPMPVAAVAPAPAPPPPPAPLASSAPSVARTPSTPPRSIRPSTPPPEDDTARMLEDLDAGFDSIVQPGKPAAKPAATKPGSSVHPPPIPRVDEPPPEAREARHQADMTEVRELFAGIAVAYARPMRDFMLEVAWGDPTHEWIEVALPATQSLRGAASAVELPGVDSALEGFQAALELAMGEPTITTEAREMLAGAYARLVDALPAVFGLEGERVRREPIIVRSLLLQVPGVRHVALEKLYRAGIHGLDTLYSARARDLADATGIDEALAAAICDRFQRYRREVAELAPTKDRARERAELKALIDELGRVHKEHEAAAASWAKDARARRSETRKERDALMLRVDLFLARLGETDLQRSIAKLPFQQRIRELVRFIDEANQRAAR